MGQGDAAEEEEEGEGGARRAGARDAAAAAAVGVAQAPAHDDTVFLVAEIAVEAAAVAAATGAAGGASSSAAAAASPATVLSVAVALAPIFPAAPPRVAVVRGAETAPEALRRKIADAEESAVLAAAAATGDLAPQAVARALEAFAATLGSA
jgi:hypothetical protein